MKKEYRDHIFKNIPQELIKAEPKDIDTYVVGYRNMNDNDRREFWTNLLEALSYEESGWKPRTSYLEKFKDAKGNRVLSCGLFQISIESVNGYLKRRKLPLVKSNEELFDPYRNIDISLIIFTQWIIRDGRIHGSEDYTVVNSQGKKVEKTRYFGGGRYWSQFRKQSKIRIMSAKTMKFSKVNEGDMYDRFYNTAKGEMGINEFPGKKHNKRVLEYHDTTSLDAPDDETPWCSSFVNWVVRKCGLKGTNSAAAKSWMKWGKELKKPVKGCIVVFSRKGGNHVAFYDHEDANYIYVLGGNQSNSVNISAYAKSRLLGYRGVA